MKVRTLLIDPHFRISSSIYRYSLGLGYVAQLCRQHGDVEVVDFALRETPSTLDEFLTPEDDFVRAVSDKAEQYDIVGITQTMGAYARTMRLSAAAKRPTNFILVGGSHAMILQQTVHWRETIFHDSCNTVDAIFWSEAESTLPEVLQRLEREKKIPHLAGLSVANGDAVWHAEKRALPLEMANVGRPAWDIMSFPEPRVAFLGCSRGCPYSCGFCDENFIFPTFRPRPIEDILEEVEENASRYGIIRYRVTDSTLGAHPKVLELCRGLESLGIDLRWVAYCRVNEAVHKKGLMEAFALGGCRCVYFGFESGSDAVLAAAHKGASRGEAIEAVRQAKFAGLAVKGSFILGLPGETERTIMETIEFAEALELDVINWHLLAPCYRDLRESSSARDINWMKVCTDMPDHLIPEMAKRLGAESRHLWVERHMGFRATEVPRDLVYHKCGLRYEKLLRFLQLAIDRTVQNTEMEATFVL